jgi:threonine dehydratase
MGGGGLISGIGSVLKAFSPHTKIWGIPASNSMALATSIHAGKVIETKHLDTLADAVAGGIDEDTITLSLATSVVDEFIECDEDAIVHALKALALEENIIVEGAAALALTGFEKVRQRVIGQASVVLLCGANYNQELILKAIYSRGTILHRFTVVQMHVSNFYNYNLRLTYRRPLL